MSKLLINESPLLVLPTLAKKIGLNEAIILQQVHYLMNPEYNVTTEIDGIYWVCKTYSEWHDKFSFFSERTLQRTFLNLEKLELLLVKLNFNLVNEQTKSARRMSKIYSVNYKEIKRLECELGETRVPNWHADQQTMVPNWRDQGANLASRACQIGTPYLIRDLKDLRKEYKEERGCGGEKGMFFWEAPSTIGLAADNSCFFEPKEIPLPENENSGQGGDVSIEPTPKHIPEEKTAKIEKKPARNPKPSQTSAPDDVKKVFEHWKEVMSHKNSKLDANRSYLINKAIKLGYAPQELCDAITGCSLTPFNMGENERGERYDGIHIILKSADQIERFIRNLKTPPRSKKTSKNLQNNINSLQEWL